MVKYFHFHASQGDLRRVDEPLISEQCSVIRPNGVRCRKRCLIGIHYCWIHLRSEKHLRIKDAGLNDNHVHMGQGLFADDGTDNNVIVFAVNDNIIEYEGEFLDLEARIQRYGHHTAPYVAAYNENTYYDCAIHRCVAGLINHKSHSSANCRFSVNHLNNRVRIKAIRNIRNGQQLRVSYNSNVPGNHYLFNEPGVRSSTNSRISHV
jgi:SET domain-containing protein